MSCSSSLCTRFVSREVSYSPVRVPCQRAHSTERSPLTLIHRATWKGNSANFALTEFSEVRYPRLQYIQVAARHACYSGGFAKAAGRTEPRLRRFGREEDDREDTPYGAGCGGGCRSYPRNQPRRAHRW